MPCTMVALGVARNAGVTVSVSEGCVVVAVEAARPRLIKEPVGLNCAPPFWTVMDEELF